MNSISLAEPCRLCGGATSPKFSALVRDRYEAAYLRCEGCGSLQTEKPHWLGECYAEDITPSDTYYLTRNLRSYAQVKFLCAILGLPKSAPIFDFGGGLGVLARLLRETGRTAYTDDAFTKSPFGVSAPPEAAHPALVTAIEVFEHLAAPVEDLKAVFVREPEYVYVSTFRYKDQASDWWYFAPQNGEHLFFYSDAAMRLIGERFGYHVTLVNASEALFSKRPLPGWKAALCRLAYCVPMWRFTRAWAFWRHPHA